MSQLTWSFNTASTHNFEKWSFLPWRIFELSVVRAIFIRSFLKSSRLPLAMNKNSSTSSKRFLLCSLTYCFCNASRERAVLQLLLYASRRSRFEDESFAPTNFPFPRRRLMNDCLSCVRTYSQKFTSKNDDGGGAITDFVILNFGDIYRM